MTLIDPNLIFIGTILAPIATEFATKNGASSKAKQWAATVITGLIILISVITHFAMGDIDLSSSADVYAFIAFLFAQFGIIRATVEGGHRGFDLAENATGKSLSEALLPSVGFGGGSEQTPE